MSVDEAAQLDPGQREPHRAVDAAGCADLCDPDRVHALGQLGLTSSPDPAMDALAERVRCRLRVPTALVSLVRPDQQVFPGMAGLPEPWATKRATPLTHSFCRHVVISGSPLIIEDARTHPLVRDNLAVPDLGVIAYAGIPIGDEDGNVLGSLCAIDTRPRRWTDTEIDALRDLALACSTELSLRLSRYDADVERDRRDQLEQAMQRSFDRSQSLLQASQAFTETTTINDVNEQVHKLVNGQLRPAYVGVSLLDEQRRLHRLPDDRFPMVADGVDAWRTYPLDTGIPSARAVRESRTVHYSDRERFDADHDEPARRLLRELDLHAVIAVPLPSTDGPLGAMVLGWSTPRTVEPTDLLTISTIAGYAARALDRARRLQHRTTVAHQLQEAMLTTLPDTPGLTMAAIYQPADSREHVGGDWYDAAPVGDPGRPHDQLIAVSVGDVMGHNVGAATIMGQVRSMLRQSTWDHIDGTPSEIFTAFETANTGIGLGATGTALLAHLRRTRGDRWSIRWTNAGHPPPVLVRPDGPAELLPEHDPLFGFRFTAATPRRDFHREIEPGSTLFLYTDGLVEKRGSDLDAGTTALTELLAEARNLPPHELVDLTVATLAPDALDDVVAFAIHFPETGLERTFD